MKIKTLFIGAVVLALLLPLTALAQMSDDPANSPLAAGTARLGNTAYVYARIPGAGNSVYMRRTNGISFNDWERNLGGVTYYAPAAANSTNYINVFVRGTTNHLYVCKTTDGWNYTGWRDLGGVLNAAPSAVYFRGRMYCFVRGGGSSNITYYTSSSDGWNFSGFASLGGYATSAPLAVVRGNTLHVYVRGSGYNLHERHTTDGVTWSGWSTVHGFTMNTPTSSTEYGLPANVGACNIGMQDAANWDAFYKPEQDTMNSTLVKFQMCYDHDWDRWDFYYRASDVIDVINLGAREIIFRTADSRCSAKETSHFIDGMVFSDTRETLIAFIERHPSVTFWIEVGNEPDLVRTKPYETGVPAWDARWFLLDTIKNVKPRYAHVSNLKWMASMPTRNGRPGVKGEAGWDYSAIMYSDAGGETVQDQYDALGTHAYGWDSLHWTDGNNPLGETYYALARLPLGKLVYITEAGINNKENWSTKGSKFRTAMRQAPWQVQGWAFFALTRNPDWNCNLYYAIDTYYGCNYPLNIVPGRPCASALGAR